MQPIFPVRCPLCIYMWRVLQDGRARACACVNAHVLNIPAKASFEDVFSTVAEL
jgi:hypothetical protein